MLNLTRRLLDDPPRQASPGAGLLRDRGSSRGLLRLPAKEHEVPLPGGSEGLLLFCTICGRDRSAIRGSLRLRGHEACLVELVG